MKPSAQRRLAAIVSVDVVGYSRLMGIDEVGTLASLRGHRAELVDPKIAEHGGRIVKTMGDGLLLEFQSVVAATTCAIEVQEGMAERNNGVEDEKRIVFRIGVHVGDVIVEEDDILGDGVNLAARIESLAAPGGVAISNRVHDDVRNRLEATFSDSGEHSLKNIAKPIRVWRWASMPEPSTTATIPPLPLPEKPSIAVLPFDNMSGDPEQEYFADGIAEDVITALSRFRSLFVIARNSSFIYKGRPVDIAHLSRELGVRYVIEGSVRKAGSRVRITAQLIDAASGNHLWADRFDGSLDDVFDLQDRITEQIVAKVEPEIGVRELERVRRKPPANLGAWELMQQGLWHFYHVNKDDHAEAIRLFREAVAVDPDFAAAHAQLAYALRPSQSMKLQSAEEAEQASEAARLAAETAISLDPSEPMAHFALGRLHVLAGENETAISEMQTAIEINPSFALGHYGLGYAYYWATGQSDQALPHFDTALRLNPRGPLRWTILMNKGSALRDAGRVDDAVAACRQACQFPDVGFLPFILLAAALADAGRNDEARASVQKAETIDPGISIGSLRNHFAGLNDKTVGGILDSLQKAGMPA